MEMLGVSTSPHKHSQLSCNGARTTLDNSQILFWFEQRELATTKTGQFVEKLLRESKIKKKHASDQSWNGTTTGERGKKTSTVNRLIIQRTSIYRSFHPTSFYSVFFVSALSVVASFRSIQSINRLLLLQLLLLQSVGQLFWAFLRWTQIKNVMTFERKKRMRLMCLIAFSSRIIEIWFRIFRSIRVNINCDLFHIQWSWLAKMTPAKFSHY